jgi:hypothetical protein
MKGTGRAKPERPVKRLNTMRNLTDTVLPSRMVIFHPADGLPGKWKNQGSAQLPQAAMPHA